MARKTWKTAAVVVGLGWATLSGSPPPALSSESLTFLLDWIPYAAHVGMYTALDRGLYSQAGLTVNIVPGQGSGDTIKRVGVGRPQVGFADTGSLVVGRAKGIPAKVVGMVLDKSMFIVYTLKKGGIRAAKDLEGRKVGTPKASSTYIMFPALAALNTVDMRKIDFVFMTSSALIPSLMARKVDAILTYDSDSPAVFDAARKANEEVAGYLYSRWGLDLYSNGLITSDEFIRNKPDVVRAFVHGTLKGTAWAVEHPKEAVDIFLKHNAALDRDLTRKTWVIVVDHLLTPTAQKMGLGHMDRKKMELTRDIVAKYMKLPVQVPVEDIYTNRFLPKIFPKAPGPVR